MPKEDNDLVANPDDDMGASEASPDISDELLDDYALKRVSKNPKGSARGKYNRRKLALAHAARELKYAIEEMIGQPGTTYKKGEVTELSDICGIILAKFDFDETLSQEQCDAISDALGLPRFQIQ